MATDFERPPEYDVLVDTLIEKTKAGKLDWQETANAYLFIAAVKGKQTFEVALNEESELVLRVKDENGKPFFETPSQPYVYGETLFELYTVARRVAMHLDERIGASIELVQTL